MCLTPYPEHTPRTGHSPVRPIPGPLVCRACEVTQTGLRWLSTEYLSPHPKFLHWLIIPNVMVLGGGPSGRGEGTKAEPPRGRFLRV